MKIQVKRTYRYRDDSGTHEITPGHYEVPGDISEERARRILLMRCGVKLPEKKAPENKVVEAPENKAGVARKAKHRRGAGTVSD